MPSIDRIAAALLKATVSAATGDVVTAATTVLGVGAEVIARRLGEWANSRDSQRRLVNHMNGWAREQFSDTRGALGMEIADISIGMEQAARILKRSPVTIEMIVQRYLSAEAVASAVIEGGGHILEKIAEPRARDACGEAIRASVRQLTDFLRDDIQLSALATLLRDREALRADVASLKAAIANQETVYSPVSWRWIARRAAEASVLVDRDREIRQLAEAVHDEPGVLWIHAARYAGKTRLLLAVASYNATPTILGRDVDVISLFLGRAGYASSESEAWRAAIEQLRYLLRHVQDSRRRSPESLIEHRETFDELWKGAGDYARSNNRQLVLIVDGVDEVDGQSPDNSLELFLLRPELIEENTHVILTSTTECFERATRRAAFFTNVHINPWRISVSSAATVTLEDAQRDLRSVLADTTGGIVLATLAAANGQLTVADLSVVTGLDRIAIRRVINICTPMVLHSAAIPSRAVGDDPDSHGFAHSVLHDECATNADLDVGRRRIDIETWADDWRDRGWSDSVRSSKPPSYFFREFPLRFLQADRTGRGRLVSDPMWVSALVRHRGIDDAIALVAEVSSGSDSAMLTILQLQRVSLGQIPTDDEHFVIRQIALQAIESEWEDELLNFRASNIVHAVARLMPVASSRRTNPGRTTLIGRHPDVSAIAVCDGVIFSGAMDGSIVAWDTRTPGKKTQISDRGRRVNSLLPIAGGDLVSTGAIGADGIDGPVILWGRDDMGSYQPRRLATHENDARSAVLDNLDDPTVISVGYDGQIFCTNLISGEVRRRQHSVSAYVVVGLPQRRLIVVASGPYLHLDMPYRVLLYDCRDNDPPVLLHSSRSSITCLIALDLDKVAFVDDGNVYVASVDHPSSLRMIAANRSVERIVRVSSTLLAANLSSGAQAGLISVENGEWHALSSRGLWAAVAADVDNCMIVAQRDGIIERWRVRPPSVFSPRMVAFMPFADSNLIIADEDGALWEWDLSLRETPYRIGKLSEPITDIRPISDRQILTIGGGMLVRWIREPAVESFTPQLLGEVPKALRDNAELHPLSEDLVIVFEGVQLVGGGRAFVWEHKSSGELFELTRGIGHMCATAAGCIVASRWSWSWDVITLEVWSRSDGRWSSRTIDVPGGGAPADGEVAALADGRVVLRRGGEILLIDLREPEDLRVLCAANYDSHFVVLAPDHIAVAECERGEVRIFSVNNSEVLTIRVGAPIHSMRSRSVGEGVDLLLNTDTGIVVYRLAAPAADKRF